MGENFSREMRDFADQLEIIEKKFTFSTNFVFPHLERHQITSSEDLKSKSNDIIFQIPAFLLTSEKKSLDDFLKLRENKKAMEFIYKLYFEVYGENKDEFNIKLYLGNFDFQTILNNNSLDEFLKTNPDFELRNIFLSLLIVVPLFFKKNDDKFFSNFFKKIFLNMIKKLNYIYYLRN